MQQPIRVVRENVGLTQEQVANLVGIPVKTIRNWEQNIRKPREWVMNLIIDRILREKSEQTTTMDENQGILSFLTIKKIVSQFAEQFNIKSVYLFGSYAKGEANDYSDIDLYIESDLYGLDYFEFIEILRENLGKKIEVLSNKTIEASSRIDQEIKKTGVLIYERQ